MLNNTGYYSTFMPPLANKVEIRALLSQHFAMSWGKTANDTHWPHVRKYQISDKPGANTSQHQQQWAGVLLVSSYNTVFPGLLQWWSCPGDNRVEDEEKKKKERLVN
jgi:hypothetical protein